MEKPYHQAQRYRMAAALLPKELRDKALTVPTEVQERAEEFRLRSGFPATLLLPEGELDLTSSHIPLTGEDLREVLQTATEGSAYRSAESIRSGFVTVHGGFRIGICGTAVIRSGEISTLGNLSSLSVRIAKEVRGAAEGVYAALIGDGLFSSTLILSPPGGGKTTLLRDLVRLLSNGCAQMRAFRTSIVDERGEIAAVVGGVAQFDVGRHTDVLTGIPKAEGIIMLLRAMNPELIALDEITAPEDIRAMQQAANCGVGFLATVHGANLQELRQRAVFCELLNSGIFKRIICIERKNGQRLCRIET